MVTRLPKPDSQDGILSDASKLTPDFPYATVLVSGGHNMVLLTTGIGSHRILGSTLDDSIGEAFDKYATTLPIQVMPWCTESEESQDCSATGDYQGPRWATPRVTGT
jgi:tRNA A37 threonylcarbamoyltransferase TsaD